MKICGLKLTHDGAIALVDNGKLIFSYEMEKLNNNKRYSDLSDFYTDDFLNSILKENGYKIEDIDNFVIDGWGDTSANHRGENDHLPLSLMLSKTEDEKVKIDVNGYGLMIKNEDVLRPEKFNYPEHNLSYTSYFHISGHIFSGYCTSPFAKKKENSFILTWDGGMLPQLFYFNAASKKLENLGPIFYMLGDSYAMLGNYYPPFDGEKNVLSVAGKLMAYIALGKADEDVLAELKEIFYRHETEIQNSKDLTADLIFTKSRELLKEFFISGELNEVDAKDMLATYHVLFQEILVENLQKLISNYPTYTKNICLVGGCALNIKWNSQIRESGMFENIWIPPFPNDSGSAIGAACCDMINKTGELALDWNVYSGPRIKEGTLNAEWEVAACTLEQLAQILFVHDEPVVFLNGRAELGPRALGNRSILASPLNFSMKKRVNAIKNREDYRPIAPICIEKDAPAIFSPGSPDPFMLFDHKVKDEWKNRISAVCHLDGTARLQTVNESENPEIFFLLQKFKELSKVPLLCNTSANLNGSGFFPDVESAMTWGKIDIIWSGNKIYVKKNSYLHTESEIFKKETV